jgi:lysophospholipase L1-like esterase
MPQIIHHRPLRRHREKSVFFLLFLPVFLWDCASPVRPAASPSPDWDTVFFAGKVRFPNDSIYARSLVAQGSNWRTKRFLEKCRSKYSVRLGFIGGSITAGAVASRDDLRFSNLLCALIKKRFPNLTNVVEINAGRSGTPSRYGCSRASCDLLAFAPDLIVIEFSVNDFETGDATYIREVYEGLVRQCLSYREDVPVILLFMSKGDGRNAQDLHAEVGSWYGLPMISFRDAVWPLVQADYNYWNTFFHDDPHPNDTGHRVCAMLLSTYLRNADDQPGDTFSAVPHFRYSNLYQNAGFMIPGDTTITMTQSSWPAGPPEEGRPGFLSGAAGDSLVLQACGNEMTFMIDKRPSDTSSIHITMDGGALETDINNYFRSSTRIFQTVYLLPTAGPHTVRVVNLKSQPFFINSILYARYSQ